MRVGGESPGVEFVPQEAARFHHDNAVAAKPVVLNWHRMASGRIIAIAERQNLKCANNVRIPRQVCSVAAPNADFDRNSAAVIEDTLRGISANRLVKPSERRVPDDAVIGELALDGNHLLTL